MTDTIRTLICTSIYITIFDIIGAPAIFGIIVATLKTYINSTLKTIIIIIAIIIAVIMLITIVIRFNSASVPYVCNMSVDNAVQTLSEAGFRVKVNNGKEDYPLDSKVISQSPGNNTEILFINKDTIIEIITSDFLKPPDPSKDEPDDPPEESVPDNSTEESTTNTEPDSDIDKGESESTMSSQTEVEESEVLGVTDIEIAYNTKETAKEIKIGDELHGLIREEDRDDYYKFTLESAQNIVITLYKQGNMMLYAELLDSHDELIHRNAVSGYTYDGEHAESNEYSQLDKGTYYIHFNDLLKTFGEYKILITNEKPSIDSDSSYILVFD